MGYNFSTDWFSEYAPNWLKALDDCGIARDAERNVLELGSFEGRSACWISDNLLDHPGSSLTCVDTFCGSPEYGTMFSAVFQKARQSLYYQCINNVYRSRNFEKVFVCPKSTTEYFANLEIDGARPIFDLVYIDAGHHEEEAYRDGILSHRYARPGALLIFDDYLWAPHFDYPVKRAVARLEKELPMRLIFDGWQRIYQV